MICWFMVTKRLHSCVNTKYWAGLRGTGHGYGHNTQFFRCMVMGYATTMSEGARSVCREALRWSWPLVSSTECCTRWPSTPWATMYSSLHSCRHSATASATSLSCLSASGASHQPRLTSTSSYLTQHCQICHCPDCTDDHQAPSGHGVATKVLQWLSCSLDLLHAQICCEATFCM